MKNYNETIYSSSHMISVSGVHNRPLREITMLALLSETGCLNDVDTYNDIRDISVVWYDNDGEIVVEQIYNQETGEVYWWDKPEEVWTDNDELLVNTLLMWGELESTIDGGC